MNMPFSRLLKLVACCHAVVIGIQASDENDLLLDDFMQTLQQTTEIATKSRLNIDHVPGNVETVSGEELKRLGYMTLSGVDFKMVLGVENPLHTMRGVGGGYGSSKVLYLLNGIEINNQLFGNSHMGINLYPPFSVDLVERVEIIRGPGSSVYGGYAYHGVINVITKKEPSLVSAHTESLGNGDFLSSLSVADHYQGEDYTVTALASYLQNDGYRHTVQTDVLYPLGLGDFSYAPDEVELFSESKAFQVDYQDEKNELGLTYSDIKNGEMYGQSTGGVLPPNDGKNNVSYQRLFLDYARKVDLDEYGELKFDLLYHLHDEENNDMHFKPPIPGYLPYGMVGGADFTEQRYSAGVEWKKEAGNHHLLLGGEYTFVDSENVDFQFNLDPHATEDQYLELNTPDQQTYTGDKNFMREGVDRTIISLYAQDEWEINPALMLTYGLRYDSYDDIDDSISPRAALVWKVDDQHILKAQYAKAYRPPNFYEVYTQFGLVFWDNPNFNAETAQTAEVTHVYKNNRLRLSNTLLYTKMDDLLRIGYGAGQFSGSKVYGWESEANMAWKQFELKANFSMYQTHDEDTDEKFTRNPHLLGNLIGTYYMTPDVPLTVWLHHRGKQERPEGDETGDVSAKNYLNASLQWNNRQFQVTLFGTDLTNEETEAASTPQLFTDGLIYKGRTVGLQISYAF